MSRKKPTPNGNIVASGTPIGLNEVIRYICARFNLAFNIGDFPVSPPTPVEEPILQIFGLVDKYEDAQGNKYPVGYNQSGGTMTDPINLLPTDRWHGFMFADYEDPVTLSIPEAYKQTQRNWYQFKVKVAFVFFFNMKRQKYYVKWGDDYRVQKEYLMQRIVSVLSKDSVHKGARFEITEVWDRSIEGVYKGYSVKGSNVQTNITPYYAVRVETLIQYNQTCMTFAGLPPTGTPNPQHLPFMVGRHLELTSQNVLNGIPVTFSATAPTNPYPGDLWFDSSDTMGGDQNTPPGRMKIWNPLLVPPAWEYVSVPSTTQETDPIFTQSEAYNFEPGDKNALDNAVQNSHAPGSDNQDLSGLVVKVSGSSLVPDTEISKIHALHADDQDLSGKVDKVTGSSLVADTEISKIHALHADDQDLSGYSQTNHNHALANLSEKSYNSLSDKPTIPAAQIQSDWTQASNVALDYIKNKPTLPAAKVVSTKVVILALTPTSGLDAFATDTLEYFIANGTSWYKAIFPMAVASANPDIGLETYNNENDYGIDYISGKRLSNVKIGTTTKNEEGAVKMAVVEGINAIQFYLNGALRTAVVDKNFREVNGILQTKPIGYTEWLNVFSGSNLIMNADGDPFVIGYQGNMGVY